MANLIIPPQSDLALALREPNLLVPWQVPLGGRVKISKWAKSKKIKYLGIPSLNWNSKATGWNNLVDNVAVSAFGNFSSSVFQRKGETFIARSSGRAILPQGTFDVFGEMTLCAAVDHSFSNRQTLVSNGQYNDSGWYLQANDSSANTLYFRQITGGSTYTSTGTINNGFNFIGVTTIDSVAPVMYKNGTVSTISSTAGTLEANTSSYNCVIGDYRDSGIYPWASGEGIYFIVLFEKALTAAEHQEFYRNPFALLFEPANDTPYLFSIPGGAAGVTVTVPQANLSLSTFAPDVSVPVTAIEIDVGQASLTLSTTAPTVERTANRDITVAQANLALSTEAPDVETTANVAIDGVAGNLTLSTTAPDVERTDNRDITVAQADISLSTAAPNVLVTAAGTIVVDAANLTISAEAPTVEQTANRSITVGAANLTLSTTAPTASRNIGISPAAGSLLLSTLAPELTVAANQAITVDAAALALSTAAPTVDQTTNSVRLPGAASLSLSGFAPTIEQTGRDIWTDVSAASTSWTEITGASTTWTEI